MREQELREKSKALYDALKAEMKNNGEKVSDRDMLPVVLAFDIGTAVLVGFFSLVESAAVLAKAKRTEMGWRPGDEVKAD